MAVPNETIFGVDEVRNSINYGFVRQLTDENRLINLLKFRIEVFFTEQVKPLEAVSPFPLSVLTCVGIETLGEITIAENKDDSSYQFTSILGKFDKSFSKQLNKKDKILKFKIKTNGRYKKRNSTRCAERNSPN